MPKITELPANSTTASNDLMPMVDLSGTVTQKITLLQLAAAMAANFVAKALALTKLDGGSTAGVLVTDSSGVVTANTMAADANGWQVINLGSVKIATKKVTFSQTVTTGGSTLSLSSTNLPVGLATVGAAKSMTYGLAATGFSYALSCVYEGSQSATALNFTGRSADSTRAYDGTLGITFIF